MAAWSTMDNGGPGMADIGRGLEALSVLLHQLYEAQAASPRTAAALGN